MINKNKWVNSCSDNGFGGIFPLGELFLLLLGQALLTQTLLNEIQHSAARGKDVEGIKQLPRVPSVSPAHANPTLAVLPCGLFLVIRYASRRHRVVWGIRNSSQPSHKVGKT
ncbi:hypothetical protein [Metapseudomonas otitidis]|uniref:hypothetical protein n=1 Tax=Metapseudomonas otitidis TaxID=319939 RepID=UPI001602B7D5|nr:hypothetical protein [Pseudomonas otitidis]